ncbi:MAG: peptidase M16 [Firmicutes bacterium HGW-Firmicutes-1]|jgi:predicted Zn-dependent peptidase|nr:MAG: peptidase M16 [Firmicutes bacterium HGW-Firmicutes-1]
MVKTARLKNGICVIGEENNFVRTISIGIWIRNGSIDEDDSTNGISHFIEHMIFKGTNKRTARDIADEMSEVGGRINAFTSKEYMCYYAHVLDNHFGVALDVLSDMICNSTFKEDEIEKEKGVILEEIKMCEDSPEDMVMDALEHNVWQGHSLSYNILGTEENVRKFSRSDMLSYLEKHYIAENMVISVVGKMDFDNILTQLEESFSGIKNNKSVERIDNATYQKSFSAKNKDIEQAHICLAFPSISYESEKVYMLSILNTIIGGGINSRLFQSIREERGLAYAIYSYPESYKYGGLFNVYAASSPVQIEEVLIGILDELDKLVKKGFNEKELNMTKEQIKSNMIIGLESMSSRMSNYGKSKLILNSIKSQDEIIKKINEVTLEALIEFSKEILDPLKMSVSIIGNLEEIDIERIEEICKRSKFS